MIILSPEYIAGVRRTYHDMKRSIYFASNIEERKYRLWRLSMFKVNYPKELENIF